MGWWIFAGCMGVVAAGLWTMVLCFGPNRIFFKGRNFSKRYCPTCDTETIQLYMEAHHTFCHLCSKCNRHNKYLSRCVDLDSDSYWSRFSHD